MESLEDKITRVLKICQEAKELINSIESEIHYKNGVYVIPIKYLDIQPESIRKRVLTACNKHNILNIGEIIKFPKTYIERGYIKGFGFKAAQSISEALYKQYEIEW